MSVKTIILSAFLAAIGVHAAPQLFKRAFVVDDATVLNYALTLEHLENAFYAGALAKFDQDAFVRAGLPEGARARFVEIGQHEKGHVAFLSGALGAKATQPCEYNFPYTDPKSFAAVSQILEGVGVSAYIGAARFISNKDYLTAAASVLANEARHASFVAAAVNKRPGWSGAVDVPLGFNEVYTLAASFITSCPSTNPPLPVKAYPALTVTSGNAKPGSTIAVSFDSSAVAPNKALYVSFFTGLSKKYAIIRDGKVTIPSDLKGTVYAVVTKSPSSASNGDIVAGPMIFNFDEPTFVTQEPSDGGHSQSSGRHSSSEDSGLLGGILRILGN